MKPKDYHFYAVSSLACTKHSDIENCIKNQRRIDTQDNAKNARYCLVFRVPVPVTHIYTLLHNLPLIDDLQFIDKIDYSEVQT